MNCCSNNHRSEKLITSKAIVALYKLLSCPLNPSLLEEDMKELLGGHFGRYWVGKLGCCENCPKKESNRMLFDILRFCKISTSCAANKSSKSNLLRSCCSSYWQFRFLEPHHCGSMFLAEELWPLTQPFRTRKKNI